MVYYSIILFTSKIYYYNDIWVGAKKKNAKKKAVNWRDLIASTVLMVWIVINVKNVRIVNNVILVWIVYRVYNVIYLSIVLNVKNVYNARIVRTANNLKIASIV